MGEALHYDAQGNMLSELNESWQNGQCVSCYTYFDAQGNIFHMNRLNGQWVNSYRGTYTYDAQGNMLSYLNENWENGQLVNSYRGTYTYDAQGNMLSELRSWQNGQLMNSSAHLHL